MRRTATVTTSALAELTFNDSTPFLGSEASDWLYTAPAQGGKASGAHPWEQAFDAAGIHLRLRSKIQTDDEDN